MNHHFKIISIEEEEESFLRESLRCPSMTRVIKKENKRGKKSKFNRKNRNSNRNSKAKWTEARCERFRRKIVGSDDSSCEQYNQPVYGLHRTKYEESYHDCDFRRSDQQLNEWDDINQLLPAEELGIEEGSMYNRLISILEGDDITPEDYDLLRLLDANNVTTTLDKNEVSQFDTFTIGTIDVNGISGIGSNDDEKCDICLESWSDLPKETEIRRLPCKHIFCKNCIDDWLLQRSQKCPNLSCYWDAAEE